MPDIILPGSAGRIEARYQRQKNPGAPMALVLHPHPQFGGTMNNPLVYDLFHMFHGLGCTTVRFNFRGVGRSAGTWDEGRGEMDDFRAAVDYLAAQYPTLEMWAAGFSFGSYIATTAGAADPRIGALIAIERDINLKGFVETGVPIDAKFTKELVLTIFHPKTVLHDGGMVVSGDRIVAAACIFPLTQREDLDRNLGLRHRAGLGLGEESDAITLVVSEETGQVSICHAGRIERNLGVEKFRLRLSQLLFQEKYESDPAQPLASEADEPDSGLRPVVSHQAERRPDTGAA